MPVHMCIYGHCTPDCVKVVDSSYVLFQLICILHFLCFLSLDIHDLEHLKFGHRDLEIIRGRKLSSAVTLINNTDYMYMQH